MVSAGSTGAVLAGGLFIVGRMEGVKRPALAPFLPTINGGKTLLIDCGANVDCKPEYLKQFAIMGSIYVKAMLGIENPKVGLISNGTEDHKGVVTTAREWRWQNTIRSQISALEDLYSIIVDTLTVVCSNCRHSTLEHTLEVHILEVIPLVITRHNTVVHTT